MPDFNATTPTVFPSSNDVAAVAGDGKTLKERSLADFLLAYLLTNNFVVAGLTVPGSSGTLNLTVAAGTAYLAGRRIDIAATVVTCTASATNHLFLKLARDVGGLVNGVKIEVNTTGVAPADSVKLATAVCSGSAVTSTTDARLTTAISQANLVKPCVGLPELKLQTGTASGSLGGFGWATVTFNEYSLGYTVVQTAGSGLEEALTGPHTSDPGDAAKRISVKDTSGGGSSYLVRWRYLTASDNPVIWMARDRTTGAIMPVWCSDDPTSGDIPGIAVPGCDSVKLTAQDLAALALPQTALDAADALIAAKGLKPEHRLYRALQLHAGEEAPTNWILEHAELDAAAKLRRKTKPVNKDSKP